MKDIKVKKKSNNRIKTINRVSIASEKFKDNIIHLKDINNYENNNTDYGSKNIENISRSISNRIINSSVKTTDKVINKNIKKISQTKETIKK